MKKYIGQYVVCLLQSHWGYTGKITKKYKYCDEFWHFLLDGSNEELVLYKENFHCSEIDGMNPVAINPKFF